MYMLTPKQTALLARNILSSLSDQLQALLQSVELWRTNFLSYRITLEHITHIYWRPGQPENQIILKYNFSENQIYKVIILQNESIIMIRCMFNLYIFRFFKNFCSTGTQHWNAPIYPSLTTQNSCHMK